VFFNFFRQRDRSKRVSIILIVVCFFLYVVTAIEFLTHTFYVFRGIGPSMEPRSGIVIPTNGFLSFSLWHCKLEIYATLIKVREFSHVSKPTKISLLIVVCWRWHCNMESLGSLSKEVDCSFSVHAILDSSR
jgi:hypothetical protein